MPIVIIRLHERFYREPGGAPSDRCRHPRSRSVSTAAAVPAMNIGEAAGESGVSAKMIRHYEAIGLITDVTRSDSGYRLYGAREVRTLQFIRRARDLGFSIEQMRELLALWRERGRASADVKRLALEHVRTLERKAASLQAMIATLHDLADHCAGDDRPDCPIIAGLAAPGAPATPAPESERFGCAGADPVRRRSGRMP